MTAEIIHISSATLRRNARQSHLTPPAEARLLCATARPQALQVGDAVYCITSRFRHQRGRVCDFDRSRYTGAVMMVRVDFGHARAWLSPNDLRLSESVLHTGGRA